MRTTLNEVIEQTPVLKKFLRDRKCENTLQATIQLELLHVALHMWIDDNGATPSEVYEKLYHK